MKEEQTEEEEEEKFQLTWFVVQMVVGFHLHHFL